MLDVAVAFRGEAIVKRHLQTIGITSWAMLGRCAYCMRAAVTSALVMWLIAFALPVITASRLPMIVAMLIASALSLLWIAHISAYALRRVQCTLGTPSVEVGGDVSRHSRRDLFPLFAKAFVFAAIATTVPSFFQAAKAQEDGGCPSDTPAPCGTDYCCASPAAWYCQGYTGTSQPWAQLGTFCTRSSSDEDIADLRSNCAVLISC